MLTKKEINVLELKKKGLSQKKIANKLRISQPAVSLFERNIRRKIRDSINAIDLLKELKIKYDKKNEELVFKI